MCVCACVCVSGVFMCVHLYVWRVFLTFVHVTISEGGQGESNVILAYQWGGGGGEGILYTLHV